MTNKSCSTFPAIAVALLATWGGASCSAINDASPENLGDTSARLTPVVAGDDPFSTPASGFLGSWEGTAEDPLALSAEPDGSPPVYRFPSGSSRFRLEIAPDPSPFVAVRGKLIVGDADPIAPPVDPNVGFPVGVSYVELLNYAPDNLARTTDQVLPLTEGFEYPAYRVPTLTELPPGDAGWLNVADGILKLTLHTTEVLRAWCHLQTPKPDDRGGYDCNGGLPVFGEDGSCSLRSYDPDCGPGAECDLGPVDCEKAFLCQQDHCACNASVCAVNATSSAEFRSRAELSLRSSGAELVGVLSNAMFMNPRGLATPIGKIRFQRVE
jgi:hypothetical protein